jgi:hypothetical protein
MSTHQLARLPGPTSRTLDAPDRTRGRTTAAALGAVGAGTIIAGVRLPWLSTFNHLVTQSGWGTRNGTLLVVLGAVAATLAVLQLAKPSTGLRWALAATGFVSAGFTGYLLVQLYRSLQALDTMAFAHQGPGLYVAMLGSALVFATTFVPMPVEASVVGDHREQAQAPGSLRTWHRFPVAALATAAALAHVPVTPEHLSEARYIGVLFLALTVVLILGATALLVADTAAAYAFLAAVSALAVAAYLLSRTVGLPQIGDDVGHWFEPLGVLAVVCEVGVAVLAALAITAHRRKRPVS